MSEVAGPDPATPARGWCGTPALLATVEELLGEQVYAWQMGVNCKAFAGDVVLASGLSGVPRGRPHPGAAHGQRPDLPRRGHDVNSPLMLVPGSHRYTGEMPEASDQGTSYTFRYSGVATIARQVAEAGIVVPTGAPGSVIFMHVNTLHGSTANLSPWSRRLVTVTFNAFSNKATSPSVRPAHIVPDDRDAPPLTPLGRDCLLA
jgi:ectoine hydroxylase